MDQSKGNTYNLMFGLSGDPVHQAHADMLTEVTRSLHAMEILIKEIILVPVYSRNPIGKRAKLGLPATFHHRMAFCSLIADEIKEKLSSIETRISVSDIARRLSLSSANANFDVDTLKALGAPQKPFLYLLSSDLLSGHPPEFSRWHQPEELVRLAVVVICQRPGYPLNMEYITSLKEAGGQFIHLTDIPQWDVSATDIRERLRNGEDPLRLCEEGLLPFSIGRYIADNDLYR